MGELNIGSILSFGKYLWCVLEIRDSVALIITNEVIEQRPYNERAGDVTWADSSLRQYLNVEFYNEFTEVEKSKVVPILNENLNNQWYGSSGGEDTLDYIFLLSIEEAVCKYFGDSRYNLENRSAKQRYWFQKKDKNNVKRRTTYNSHSWWWWLRSPGRDNKRGVYVHGDGNIGIQGNGTYRYNSNTIHPTSGKNTGGVRPALWLSLKD